MDLPITPPYPPMEAQLVNEVPSGKFWQYEPKWDGFRCLVFRDGDDVFLQSKAGQPLARYFPDLLDEVRSISCSRFLIDSEIVIPVGGRLSFDDLLMRIHPAESRVRKLAAQFPAVLLVFDLLVDANGSNLTGLPLSVRRKMLEKFSAGCMEQCRRILLSPATTGRAQAFRWLNDAGSSTDGVMAKRLDMSYRSGERIGMEKVKPVRTADCVVGGFRYASKGKVVGSLLLGLYNNDGLLDHVGFTSGIKAGERTRLTDKLQSMVEPPGFTGRAPGGPSRWSTERSVEWIPVRPELVVEAQYDHFTGGRFRHGTRILRWRADKLPKQCTMDQVEAGSTQTDSPIPRLFRLQ